MKTILFISFLLLQLPVFSQLTYEKAKETDYDRLFLIEMDELSKSVGVPVRLQDSVVIMDQDTFAFPAKPAFGKRQVYTARKENKAIALTLERINYTSVKFNLEIVEFENTDITIEGVATIRAGFVLGSEMDETEEGEMYSVSEYVYEKPTENDSQLTCYVGIRISDYDDMETRVKVISNCNGPIGEVTLDNFPALHEK